MTTGGGTLGRAVLELEVDHARLKRELDQAKRTTEQRMRATAASVRKIGLGVAAIGAAITGLFGLSIKSLQEQEVGINRLDQSLKNVGVSYADLEGQIEGVIESQQRLTNFGDEAQRDALQKLITIGGKWEGALDALIITQDLAAGAGIDLNAAALLVGKAIAGETSSLSRYGILIEEGATQTEIMTAIQKQFNGAAAAAVDPFTQLKNRLGDLLQVLAVGLLPIVSAMAVLMEKVTRRLIAFSEAHPRLARVLSIVVGALGALLLVIGTLLIAVGFLVPVMVTGFGLIWAAVLGPILPIIAAIAALIAIGVLIWKNWDTIKQKAIQIWGAIKDTIKKNWDIILAILFPGVGIAVLIARRWGAIKNVITGILSKITSVVIDFAATLKEILFGLLGVKFFSDLFDNIFGGFLGLKNRLSGALRRVGGGTGGANGEGDGDGRAWWETPPLVLAWDIFIKPVIWEDFIKGFLWDTVIKGFLWSTVIKGFLWDTVIKGFLWDTVIEDFLWSTFIKGFLWSTFIKGFLWSTFIKGFLWSTFIKGFLWSTFIKGFLWSTFIKGFLWDTVIEGFLWSTFIKGFLWDTVIEGCGTRLSKASCGTRLSKASCGTRLSKASYGRRSSSQ